MTRVRAGIIGVGSMGLAHLEAVRRLEAVAVAAVVCRDPERAKNICGRFDVPRYYLDYRELLADPEIAAVHNCTPNRMHFEINKEAILAGKHILSEKPLTVTATESEELTALARSHQVLNGVNFVYRHFVVIQHLRQMIRDGELGDIFAIHGSYLQDWLLRATDYNWRVAAALAGPSRAMADIGSHWCDMAQFLVGAEIGAVVADLGIFIPERIKPGPGSGASGSERVAVTTEDYGAALLRFRNGVKGSVTVSQVSSGRKSEFSFQIDGSKAAAYWNQEYPNQLWLGYRDQANQILLSHPGLLRGGSKSQAGPGSGANLERWPDAQKSLIGNFYDSILDPAAEIGYATFHDGHAVNRVVAAILRSHSAGGWQQV